MVHPEFYSGSVFLVNAQHFAECEQGQFFGKQLREIDNRPFTFQVVQQVIDLCFYFVAQSGNVSREKELALLHAHFHMRWRIQVDQRVEGGGRKFFGFPVLPINDHHIDTASLGGKDTVGQFYLLDVLVTGHGPETGKPFWRGGPHDGCLLSHLSVQRKRMTGSPGRGVPEGEIIKAGINGGINGVLLAGIDQNVIADQSHDLAGSNTKPSKSCSATSFNRSKYWEPRRWPRNCRGFPGIFAPMYQELVWG